MHGKYSGEKFAGVPGHNLSVENDYLESAGDIMTKINDFVSLKL